MKRKILASFSLTIMMIILVASLGLASSVDAAVVDVTAPTGSVTLTPGGNGHSRRAPVCTQSRSDRAR